MAEIISPNNDNRKAGVKRMKRHNLRIDMTPMVDLGFLLISFFVITTEMSKPTVARLNMPKDGTDRTKIQESAALTLLLTGNGQVWYYHGFWQDAFKNSHIYKTSFSYRDGIGDVIREKQKALDNNPVVFDGRDGLTILIKANNDADYTGVVDVLDEIVINQVKRYALVKITNEEKEFLKAKQQE